MKLVFVVLSIGIYSLAQDAGNQPAKGAKALFYDQTSGATIQGDSSRSSASNHHGASAQRAGTGLKYWVELVQPNSTQILRVNSTRVFHSGERIRLHLESNVDGRIVLIQMNSNGTSQVLFPDQRINNGDNHIKAATDTTVPAGNAWFTLDNNPGTERVMVFLNTDSAGPSQVQRPDARPSNGSVSSDRLIASNAASPDGKIDANATADLVTKIEKQRNSKSLVLEVDDKSNAPGTYLVMPISSHKSGSPEGQDTLAVEIQLKHQ